MNLGMRISLFLLVCGLSATLAQTNISKTIHIFVFLSLMFFLLYDIDVDHFKVGMWCVFCVHGIALTV